MTPEMDLLDKMYLAVERVRDRMSRATAALEAASIPYAVVGANAVAAWVATIDESAVRNTPNVDILLKRSDLDAAAAALASVGFVRCNVKDTVSFFDGPDGKPRDAVQILFAGEKFRIEYATSLSETSESIRLGGIRVVTLERLVRMKLTSFRRIDRVHLRDRLEVGLIDATWPGRFDPTLAQRLQHLIDTPEQ